MMTAESILSAVKPRTHTHSSGEWVVRPQPSLSVKAVLQSLETALPQRESSSLILKLTSHWRWCNSMKVINHLPKLRPHLSHSLWAPKLLLRASDECLVRGCSSPLGQGEACINISTALSRLLLSQDTLPWQYHLISDNVCVCMCVCVCVCVWLVTHQV